MVPTPEPQKSRHHLPQPDRSEWTAAAREARITPWPGVRELLLVGLLWGLFLLVAWVIMPSTTPSGDALSYLRMAKNFPNLADITSPYAQRWVLPAVIHALPLPPEFGFLLMTFFFLWLTGIGFWLWARTLRLDTFTCVTAMILLGLTSPIAYSLNNPWIVDAPLWAATAWAVWAATRGNLRLFGLIVLMSTLVKEQSLILLAIWPLQWGLVAPGLRRRTRIESLMLLLAGLVVYAAQYHWLPWARTADYWTYQVTKDWWTDTVLYKYTHNLEWQLFAPFGILLVLWPWVLRREPLWRPWAWLAAGVCIGFALGNDVARFVSQLFPWVLLPAAILLRRESERFGRWEKLLFGLFLLLLVAATTRTPWIPFLRSFPAGRDLALVALFSGMLVILWVTFSRKAGTLGELLRSPWGPVIFICLQFLPWGLFGLAQMMVRTEVKQSQVLLRQGDLEGALKELRFARSWTSDPSRFDLQEAGLHAFAGNWPEVLKLLDPLARTVDFDAGTWALLGTARLETGDRPGAKKALDRALVKSPSEGLALRGRVRTEVALGHPRMARRAALEYWMRYREDPDAIALMKKFRAEDAQSAAEQGKP